MAKLLIEQATQVEVIEEAASEGKPKTLKVRGLFQEADVKNGNRRIYPRSIMEREVKKAESMIESGSMLCLLNHPKPGEAPDPKRTAGIQTSLYMEGGKVYGEATIVETSAGKDVAAIVRAGGKLGISSRGVGSTKVESRNGEKVEVVGDDYELLAFDFVIGPSLKEAGIDSFVEERKETVMDPKTITLDVLKKDHPEVFEALKKDLSTELAAQFKESLDKAKQTIRAEVEAELKEGEDQTPKTGVAYVVSTAQVKAFLAALGATWSEDPEETKLAADRTGHPTGASHGNNLGGPTPTDSNAPAIEALKAGQDALLEELRRVQSELNEKKVEAEVDRLLESKQPWVKKLVKSRISVKTVEEAQAAVEKELKHIEEVKSHSNSTPAGRGQTFPTDPDGGSRHESLSEQRKQQLALIGGSRRKTA